MAVTIYDGQLPTYPTRSSWVAVPEARCYTLFDSTSGAAFEFSLDGVNPYEIGSRIEMTSLSGSALPGKSYRVLDLPTAYVRIWFNGGGTPPTGKVTVVAV